MKVLEIKNNLVKIAYDAQDNLALSGFVVIQDVNTPYVAQVMNLKADITSNFAIVKLLFTFNEEGILKNYNGTIPSLKSTVTKLPANELLDIIPIDNPLTIGILPEQNTLLKVDKSILDNNLLVCSNSVENTKRLINNIVSQVDEKVVIFDTDGTLELENKIKFGQDFKLPLNYDTINFIYNNDLEDIDPISKAVVQDIFIEVQEYIKTLPEGYLPFDTFLQVVDQQYKETNIPQLVLLKNKLLKYKELDVFAQELKDILNFTIAIEKSDVITVDISNVPPILQKEIMAYSYSVMPTVKSKIYTFVKLDNSNSSKKLLKTYLQKNNVYTITICPHEYKYINILKENAQNMILFRPLTLQHDFASYNTFLNKLNADEYIVYGAHTQNIPLIAELEEQYNINQINDIPEAEEQSTSETNTDQIESDTSIVDTSDEITQTNNFGATENSEETLNSIEIEDISEEPIQEDEEIVISEDQTEDTNDHQDYPEEIVYPDITFEEDEVKVSDNNIAEPEIAEPIEQVSDFGEIPNILEDVPEEDTLVDEKVDEDSGETEISDIQVEPLYSEQPEEDFVDTEQDSTLEPVVDYSINELDYQDDPLKQDNNEIVEQVAKDIDKTLYEKIDDTTEDIVDFTGDELTEDDLDLIDDINSEEDDNQIEFNDIETENSQVLPIYPGEDTDSAADSQSFEPGDRVSTPKYGEGVVEKMIKYGNKTLCSIEFPNIGRRLLDPAMSDITKLS